MRFDLSQTQAQRRQPAGGTLRAGIPARPQTAGDSVAAILFFHVGVANQLLKRGRVAPRSEAFGRAFEHFIFQELVAHRHYSGLNYSLPYWRTASQLEVDFILGDHQVAVEVKGVELVAPHHLKGLRTFREEYKTKRSLVVSLDRRPRAMDGITVLPCERFLQQLWDGDIIH